MSYERLQQQIRFILEIDNLKHVIRRTYLASGKRLENSAEHSWHLAMMALVLWEHANEKVDLLRVLKMVLVHDIVEIDAGDTYLYDEAGNAGKLAREQQAAERIFGLLPPDQGQELLQLWQEFEARQTADARFAAALDRFMPLLHNYHTKGRAWQENGVTNDQVIARTGHMVEGSETLWQEAEALLEEAVAQGYLAPPA